MTRAVQSRLSGNHGGRARTLDVKRCAAVVQVADLTCAETDYTGQQILVGRASNKLSCIDMIRGTITGDMETSTGTTSLCRSGMQIVCGGADGTIVLRDFRNGLRAEHTLPAHMGGVVAMHTHRDLLVSCGYTYRAGQVRHTQVDEFDTNRTNRVGR